MHPILLVDDETENLNALARLLRGQFEVVTADSPLVALKKAVQQKFHIVVSDQRMPQMTGVEFFEKLQTVQPEAIRILLTGYTDIESVVDAINRGHIYRYIAKPWDPEELKTILRQADEAYCLRRDNEEKTIALEKALGELQTLDQAKARFLALVSHELNTPVTTLLSFLSLLSQENLPPNLQKPVVSLHQASERLHEIVQEVLHFVRLEAHPVQTLSAFSFEQEILAWVNETKDSANQRKIGIEVKKKGEGTLPADPIQMRLALKNILTEVLAQATEGTSVKVSLERRPEALEIRFSQGGEPWPAQALDPLEMVKPLMNHTRHLGLRLATARFIAELHQGSLEFSPDRKELWLQLPLPPQL